jgi:cardiolipin synthase
MNLPNTLTLIRVLLIPVFVIFLLNKQSGWALVTFAVAGITDGMDGLLARLTHQRTVLGAYFDPVADKLLLASAYITLAITEVLPSWLTVIVITRDVIILTGFLIFILTDHRPESASLTSKITTTLQISTILLALLQEYPLPSLVTTLAIYGVTL